MLISLISKIATLYYKEIFLQNICFKNDKTQGYVMDVNKCAFTKKFDFNSAIIFVFRFICINWKKCNFKKISFKVLKVFSNPFGIHISYRHSLVNNVKEQQFLCQRYVCSYRVLRSFMKILIQIFPGTSSFKGTLIYFTKNPKFYLTPWEEIINHK